MILPLLIALSAPTYADAHDDLCSELRSPDPSPSTLTTLIQQGANPEERCVIATHGPSGEQVGFGVFMTVMTLVSYIPGGGVG